MGTLRIQATEHIEIVGEHGGEAINVLQGETLEINYDAGGEVARFRFRLLSGTLNLGSPSCAACGFNQGRLEGDRLCSGCAEKLGRANVPYCACLECRAARRAVSMPPDAPAACSPPKTPQKRGVLGRIRRDLDIE